MACCEEDSSGDNFQFLILPKLQLAIKCVLSQRLTVSTVFPNNEDDDWIGALETVKTVPEIEGGGPDPRLKPGENEKLKCLDRPLVRHDRTIALSHSVPLLALIRRVSVD